MSNRALRWALKLPVAGAAKAVLLVLADCLNDRTGRCDPSHAKLALFAGVDARTVRRACANLQECGLVNMIQRPGRPSQYELAIGTKGNTPDTTPDLKADKPRTPRPAPQSKTPGTMPDHPGHHARPTPDMVSKTPDTTPYKPLEPEVQPEGTGEETCNQRDLLDGDAAATAAARGGETRKQKRTSAAQPPDVDFDRFWAAYPRKVGKADARKAFAKAIRKTTLATMLAAIASQWWSTDPTYQKHPSGWLNGERWLDQANVEPTAKLAVCHDMRYFGRPAAEVAKLPQPRVGSPEHHAWVAANDGLETPEPDTGKSKIRTAL
jgi:Helix-turn-helix domain